MRPCSIVQPTTGEHKGKAGRVEAHKLDKEGELVALVVKLDTGETVELKPDAVKVLVNH